MSDAQAYAKANDKDNPWEGDDDGFRKCEECKENFFFLPGHKGLETCLDHCDTIEELRDYVLELQEERNNLKRAQARFIDRENVKKPLPVDWTYKEGIIKELHDGLVALEKMMGEL